MIVEKVKCVVRRAKIVIYERVREDIFRACMNECAEYKSSRMEVCTIFFEMNIISDRVPFVNRWRLPLGLPKC
jgi:hypothetical protein